MTRTPVARGRAMSFARVVLALAFGLWTARAIYVVEWFDVFRQGTPPLDQWLIYAAYVTVAGSIGWFAPALIVRRR